MKGVLKKLISKPSSPVEYKLPIGDERIPLNELINQKITLEFTGKITCLHCKNTTAKSYNQGYCFPCSRKLAACDMCLLKPHLCHYHKGTCREPSWGLENCFIPHYVYLANTSGLKVGIMRAHQRPIRWIDQGATQALVIFEVASRYQSGLIEEMISKHVADKTNWRAMLKGPNETIDLKAKRDQLFYETQKDIQALTKKFNPQSIQLLTNEEVQTLDYPVDTYPEKVTSLNFDKTARIEGILKGIKGQYLILDNGVFNIRKHTSYEVII